MIYLEHFFFFVFKELTKEMTLMKRDMEILLLHHLQRIMLMKEKATPNIGQYVESPLFQQFSDLNVLAKVNKIVNKVMKVSRVVSKIEIPSFNTCVLELLMGRLPARLDSPDSKKRATMDNVF